MVLVPQAVRVRTSSGWQDVALQGPPGVGIPTPASPAGAFIRAQGGAAIWQSGVEGRDVLWHRGTTPPASPQDGDLWIYPTGFGSGQWWMFVYDSSEATYKWKYVGGSPVASQDAVNRAGSWPTSAWVQPYTPNPSLTLPRAGDYLIEAGCTAYPASAGASWWLGIQINAVNPTVDNVWTAGAYSPVASARVTVALRLLGTSFVAGAGLVLVYQQAAAAQNFQRQNAYMFATPLRVS